MKKYDLIEFLNKNNFEEYFEVNDKVEKMHIKVLEKDIYIYTDKKRIIVLKAYESFKGAYNNYEEIQNKIKAVIEVVEKKFRKNVYFFLCINEKLQEKYIKIINLIEKDQYICKKYVITSDGDFERISFLKTSCSENAQANYNDIKVNDIFLKLVEKYCENKKSMIYAKDYLDNNRINLENEE